MKSLKLLVLLFSIISDAKEMTEELTVVSIRNPVTVIDSKTSEAASLLMKFDHPQDIHVGNSGGIAIQGSEGTEISVIGPAMIRYHGNSFQLDYGDFHVHRPEKSEYFFSARDLKPVLQEAEFFYEGGKEGVAYAISRKPLHSVWKTIPWPLKKFTCALESCEKNAKALTATSRDSNSDTKTIASQNLWTHP
jgi:hypothetical protein